MWDNHRSCQHANIRGTVKLSSERGQAEDQHVHR